MPPYMQIPHYHLSKLPATTKVALTGFSLATLAAIAFSVFAVFAERTDLSAKGVKANFAGDERVTRETGEKFERMYAEPSKRALYDVVHPHSYMMPLLYFVLTHMMEMSYGSRGLKMGLYVSAFVSMMLTAFAPLLVAWKLSFAGLVIGAVSVMSLTFAYMAVVPAWQMWFSGKAKTSV